MPSNRLTPTDFGLLEWLNTEEEINRDTLRQKVVLLFSFNMLGNETNTQAIRQAQRFHNIFRNNEQIVIVGVHASSFDDRPCNRNLLAAYLLENKIDLPVATYRQSFEPTQNSILSSYDLSCTPSLIMFEQSGFALYCYSGLVEDNLIALQLGRSLKHVVPSAICDEDSSELSQKGIQYPMLTNAYSTRLMRKRNCVAQV